MTKKLKSFLQNDQHFFGLLVIVAACASFYLGRLSVVPVTQRAASDPVVITPAPRVETPVVRETGSKPPAVAAVGGFVASKSGTKYHRADCPGASQIKPENIVRFETAAAAAAAGYTPAANCPGL